MSNRTMIQAIPSDRAVGAARLQHLEQAARKYGVPVEDVLLIAVNLYGITSDQDRHRARVNLRLMCRPEVPWQVIVPLNRPASPFRLRGDELSLNGAVVAHVDRVDADEAVGGTSATTAGLRPSTPTLVAGASDVVGVPTLWRPPPIRGCRRSGGSTTCCARSVSSTPVAAWPN